MVKGAVRGRDDGAYHLQISPLAISEALSFYANIYAKKAQAEVLNTED